MDERPFRTPYVPRPQARTPVPEPATLAPTPDDAPVTTPKSPEKDKKKGRTKRVLVAARVHWWKVLIAVVIIGGLAFFLQNYFHTRNELKKLSDSKTAAQASDQQLINEVSAYVVLPQNETPTVATVNDVSRLKNQVFFLNAQNGDKVLIFSQAKTAILYRPSVKKIVEYAPINVDASSGGTSSTTPAPATNTTTKKQ